MPANPGNAETITLGIALTTLAALLAAYQWFELSRRRTEAVADPQAAGRRAILDPEAEAAHLAALDRRRLRVAGVLAAIGLLMLGTTRIDAQAGRDSARLWAWTWLGILALALFLIVLAAVDWYAGRVHARRQGRALIDEHRALLTEVLRRRGPGRTEG